MFLSLNRWPPVLSHFCCLFLGMALVNLTSKKEREQYVPGRMILPLPETVLGRKAFMNTDRGRQILFGRRESDHSLCAIKNARATVLQTEPFVVVGVAFKHVPSVIEVLEKKNRGRVTVLGE